MNSGFLILDKMYAPGKITVLAVMGNIVKCRNIVLARSLTILFEWMPKLQTELSICVDFWLNKA